jgi:sulfatase maturation enzyme AslB (radical SAM superfamily)
LPFLTESYNLNFYGGEPLLCFALIERTISFLEEKNKQSAKKAHYALTTNGSLLTEKIIQALSRYRFTIEYSFDGFAQNIQRKSGSFDAAVSNIERILESPGISLEINSVFTPETAGSLSASVSFMVGLGVKDINLSLSLLRPWNEQSLDLLREELANVTEFLCAHYQKHRSIPVKNFRDNGVEGFFYCAGGQDRMAVNSAEEIWGCDLFGDYFLGKEDSPVFSDFFFGHLDTFAQNHEKVFLQISTNYARLAMDNFATPHRKCLFCSNLESCTICPAAAAFSGKALGEIPCFVCEIQKIRIAEQQKFWKKIS